MTAEELIEAARRGGASAIGADLTVRSGVRGPSNTRGASGLLEDRMKEATSTDRADER
jgi:hypothetical protein